LEDKLSAVPFDLNTLELTGDAILMGEDVFRSSGAPQYVLSTSGTLVYMPQNKSRISNERALVWVDRHGNEELLSFPYRSYRGPQISPDGTKLALLEEDNTYYDIWILDLVGGMETKLTSTDTREGVPLWTPDSRQIAFYDFLANFGISWKASDGKGNVEHLYFQPGRVLYPAFWVNDGKALLVERATVGQADYDIGLLPIEGDRQWSPLLQEEYAEVQPRVSPNEQWMAYTSNESGQYEIYLLSFPEVNQVRKQVSVNGGDSPIWSSDGRELFYRNGDAVFLRTVKSEPTLQIGEPQELFQGKYLSADLTGNDFISNPWDISPNDKKFLMIKPIETSAEEPEAQNPRKIIVVTNWIEELKKKVPVD
jgi:Tol biopolymer transport system component